jgi:hypothetical protein
MKRITRWEYKTKPMLKEVLEAVLGAIWLVIAFILLFYVLPLI